MSKMGISVYEKGSNGEHLESSTMADYREREKNL